MIFIDKTILENNIYSNVSRTLFFIYASIYDNYWLLDKNNKVLNKKYCLVMSRIVIL